MVAGMSLVFRSDKVTSRGSLFLYNFAVTALYGLSSSKTYFT